MKELPVVLQLCNVNKSYKRSRVLKGVSFSLQQGKIYGLLGQNGAGKTTIMRIAAGLVFADSGSIELLGCKDSNGLSQKRKHMGSIIENPALYPNLTAEENINIAAKLKNITNKNSYGDILKLLDLEDSTKKVKDYSLGMKQKVGIVIALLGEPDLLVLDEPLNGLDPITIVRVRDYLTKLVDQKQVTILISSHMLSELDKFATDYIVIDKGEVKKIISQQDMEELSVMNKSLEEIYLDLLEEGRYHENSD